MKQRQKTELWILVAIVVTAFCFVPIVNMSYDVVESRRTVLSGGRKCLIKEGTKTKGRFR